MKTITTYNELTKNTPVNIGKRLFSDVMNIVNSIYSMNAPYANGYAFRSNCNGTAITDGSFTSANEKINAINGVYPNYWLCFTNNKFYKLNSKTILL